MCRIAPRGEKEVFDGDLICVSLCECFSFSIKKRDKIQRQEECAQGSKGFCTNKRFARKISCKKTPNLSKDRSQSSSAGSWPAESAPGRCPPHHCGVTMLPQQNRQKEQLWPTASAFVFWA